MGAINYNTRNYITLGLQPYDYEDFAGDSAFIEEIQREVDEYGGTIENAIYDYINTIYEDDYSNVEYELNKHHFYYFHVAIKAGYYEGFSLDIESNFGVAYDSWEDKRDAQKEITELKQFLIDCAGMGLVQCFPGWSTGYSDYNQTVKAIGEAVKAMREETKATPTWAQYNRDCAQTGYIREG